jgi:hypothetical protein
MSHLTNKIKATDTFHHPQHRHNCAQAIANKWHSYLGLPPSIVDDMKAFGGGRSPEGMCGALYAGLELLPLADSKKQMLDEFKNITGQTKCRDLKCDKKVSCQQCVDIADQIIEKLIGQE